MPDPVTGLIAGGTSLVGGYLQSEAAGEAAGAQVKTSRLGIEEQRRQFEAMQELLGPYVEAGTGALGAQQALLGLAGPEAQAEAIASLESSPQFQALVGQGEEALLQSASATGGVRGGNIQGALAQFRPQMLGQMIETQFGRLGGLTQLGQSSAAGVGAAGQATGANVANLLAQQGQARAGQAIAQGQAFAQPIQTFGTLGALSSMGAF